MSAYAERRNIMDNHFMPPISIETFAAYLDGNLGEDEMNRIDTLVSTNPDMKILVSVSDEVDEDLRLYLEDKFACDADMTAWEDCDFDIPNLDADITPLIDVDERWKDKEVACAADVADDFDGEIFENDEYQAMQDEDPTTMFHEDNESNAQESPNILFDDDFFE